MFRDATIGAMASLMSENCGSPDLVEGKLCGDAQFLPYEITGGFHITGGIEVLGIACLRCGALQIGVEPEKLAKLTGRRAGRAGEAE